MTGDEASDRGIGGPNATYCAAHGCRSRHQIGLRAQPAGAGGGLDIDMSRNLKLGGALTALILALMACTP
ncbi:MAG: hypothetical protein M3253_07615, partial [Chloroflexota bacterium]|nr:hypothetical protein [Chloroflexota bacterium]